MGRLSFIRQIRSWISIIGWKLFIWGIDITEEEYWNSVYEIEKSHREQKEED